MSDLLTPPSQTTTISASATYDNAKLGNASKLVVQGSGVVVTITGSTVGLLGESPQITNVIVQNGATLRLKGSYGNLAIQVLAGSSLELDGAPSAGTRFYLNADVGTAVYAPASVSQVTSSGQTTYFFSASDATFSSAGAGVYATFPSPASSFTFSQDYNFNAFRSTHAGDLSVTEQNGTKTTLSVYSTYLPYFAENFTLQNGTIVVQAIPKPVISGIGGKQLVYNTQSIRPFQNISITDPNTNRADTVQVTLSTPTGTLFDPNAATDGSTNKGTFTVQGSAATVTQALSGLVFTPNNYTLQPGQTVSTQLQITVNDVVAQTTSSVTVVQTAPPAMGYSDTTTGQATVLMMDRASSDAPNYLDWQYIYNGSDTSAFSTQMPNVFIHGGAGMDAIQVSSGQNVLDGGLGSNFLTGGSGNDTFFTDARNPGVVWSTLNNFHAGDAATLWGFTAGVSSYRWEDAIAGAPGAQGATLRANIVGGGGRNGDGVDASITFAGMSVDQARGLQVATGTQPGGNYLYLYNPGV